MGLEIEKLDLSWIEDAIDISQDKIAMLEVHQSLAKHTNDYVPMDTGLLAESVISTPEYNLYPGPYAHYTYEGVVYGPNFPVIENGVIVGWKSPPKKYPTGRAINYSTEKHLRATHHWEKAMMNERGDRFTGDVKGIIQRRLKKKGK